MWWLWRWTDHSTMPTTGVLLLQRWDVGEEVVGCVKVTLTACQLAWAVSTLRCLHWLLCECWWQWPKNKPSCKTTQPMVFQYTEAHTLHCRSGNHSALSRLAVLHTLVSPCHTWTGCQAQVTTAVLRKDLTCAVLCCAVFLYLLLCACVLFRAVATRAPAAQCSGTGCWR
jgi:hypothetical protein